MPATRNSIAAAAMAAALIGTASACGQAQHRRAAPRPRASIDGCLHAGGTTRIIRFAAPGERLRAAVVGDGPTGVVLANQTDNSVCQWLPLPSYLAADGMSVLAFDYGNGDYSEEVQAAARQLRAHGARHLVLIGASIGGAVVIDAGARLQPQPDAVVSLSAVPEVTSYPFPADARRLRSPILQVGGTADGEIQDGKDTRDLYRASPSSAKRLLLIHGFAHGVDFVGAGAGDRVRRTILDFIRAHTHG